METKTQTSSVSSTKLGVATLALLGAGGLALAALPLGKNKAIDYYGFAPEGGKCGVNAFRVKSSCGKGNYRQANVTCHDGSRHVLGGKGSCKSTAAWRDIATDVCSASCEQAPAPVDNRLPQQAAEPVNDVQGCVDTDMAMDYYTRGVRISAEGERQDSCIDQRVLLEVTCRGYGVENNPMEVRYACPNGCLDGACLPPTSTPHSPTSTPNESVSSTNQLTVAWAADLDMPRRLLLGHNMKVAAIHFSNAGDSDIEIDALTIETVARNFQRTDDPRWLYVYNGGANRQDLLGTHLWVSDQELNDVDIENLVIPAFSQRTIMITLDTIDARENASLTIRLPRNTIRWIDTRTGERYTYPEEVFADALVR